MHRSKPWYRSRLLWACVLCEAALIALDSVSFLQEVLPPRTFAYVAFAAPVIAGMLRIITKHALRFRREPRWD